MPNTLMSSSSHVLIGELWDLYSFVRIEKNNGVQNTGSQMSNALVRE